MSPFTKKLYDYIIQKNLIHKGEKVCVGVSGGADSICLLESLVTLSPLLEISLCAFHVNHSLRGAESDSDQKFVEEFCSRRKIPLRSFIYDVAELAAQSKKSYEETGRALRRKAAEESKKEFGADKIALAHHMNDCAETLLFNLVRGTSLCGLKGIAPESGYIIRPFIIFKREEIERELKSKHIIWRTDSTNLNDEYSRNKLRLNIVPYFEKNINARSIQHIASAARDIEEANEILADIVKKHSSHLMKKSENSVLIYSEIEKEKNLIAGYIIMLAFKTLTKNLTNISRTHIEQVKSLMKKQTGRWLMLPYGIRAVKVYDGVFLRRNVADKADEKKETAGKCLNFNGQTEFGGFIFETKFVKEHLSSKEIPKNRYTKWFDYDKLSDGLVLRYRKSKDYLVQDRFGHRKKLKKYFIDEKIPMEERSSRICLADGDKIVWIIGGRISEDCKIDETTSKILVISCRKK